MARGRGTQRRPSVQCFLLAQRGAWFEQSLLCFSLPFGRLADVPVGFPHAETRGCFKVVAGP
eukprot:3289647-Alexandrium_andersonii.AAC.1